MFRMICFYYNQHVHFYNWSFAKGIAQYHRHPLFIQQIILSVKYVLSSFPGAIKRGNSNADKNSPLMYKQ